jgi:adapter protein MecA 1/2
MRIEKVNENQIRCTLTREDLADRQIRLSELAYGSEKAKLLFRDMIQQANYEFGFEANDIPLMVEAIPASADSIILVITKVEYPEELDTRFSKFSDPEDDMLYPEDSSSERRTPLQGADDILGIFRKLKEEYEKSAAEAQADTAESEAPQQPQPEEKKPQEVMVDLARLFEFGRMEQVENLAHVLDGYYHGENDLYKDLSRNHFFLLIHKSDHTPEEFNKVCNIISEYARQQNYTDAIGAHFAEHGRIIRKGDALQTLARM